MCGGADVGWNGRLVNTDYVIPSTLYKVVCDTGTDNAALPDNHDFRFGWKTCHFLPLFSWPYVPDSTHVPDRE